PVLLLCKGVAVQEKVDISVKYGGFAGGHSTLGHLEKAVVLELTLKHLNALTAVTEQQHHKILSLQSDLDAFQSGFQACAREVVHYLSQLENWSSREQKCSQLLRHLHQVLAQCRPAGAQHHGGNQVEQQANCVPVIQRTQGGELTENDTDTDSGYGGEAEKQDGKEKGCEGSAVAAAQQGAHRGVKIKQEFGDDRVAKKTKMTSCSVNGVIGAEPSSRPDLALMNSLMGIPGVHGQQQTTLCMPFYFINPSYMPFLDKSNLDKYVYPAAAAAAAAALTSPFPWLYPGIPAAPFPGASAGTSCLSREPRSPTSGEAESGSAEDAEEEGRELDEDDQGRDECGGDCEDDNDDGDDDDDGDEDDNDDAYKLPHRLIEKKRRDRINECIGQLKDLLPDHLKLATLGHLEKAVVLELTLKHLNALTAVTEQQHHKILSLQSDLDAFQSGFQACAREVVHYLSQLENWSSREQKCSQLLRHLHQVLAQCRPAGAQHHGGNQVEQQANCVPVIQRTQAGELTENDTDTDSGYGGEAEKQDGKEKGCEGSAVAAAQQGAHRGVKIKQEFGDDRVAKKTKMTSCSVNAAAAAAAALTSPFPWLYPGIPAAPFPGASAGTSCLSREPRSPTSGEAESGSAEDAEEEGRELDEDDQGRDECGGDCEDDDDDGDDDDGDEDDNDVSKNT
ncbi:hypothetical protein CRUP_001968, partial [Coryphaenoides rupestris]